jgi:hypothetical protein
MLHIGDNYILKIEIKEVLKRRITPKMSILVIVNL